MTGEELPLDPTAYLFHEALESLGWDTSAEALSKRVSRLALGLPAEDELSVILSWLGKSRLIHKLGQDQVPPDSKGHYCVPDLLVVFEHEGARVPVLIEVKSTARRMIRWRADYVEGLRRYAAELGLPLLVAVRWKILGWWTLFELRTFKSARTGYRVSFEDAMKENLLGFLAGDFSAGLRRGVGLHFRMRKEEKLSEILEGSVRDETWKLRIDDAYFTNADGRRLRHLGPGIWPFFITAQSNEDSRSDDTHIYQSFVIPPEEPMVWAHQALIVLLSFQAPEARPIPWRKILQKHALPVDVEVLRQAVVAGLSERIVRRVVDMVPHTKPEFVKRDA